MAVPSIVIRTPCTAAKLGHALSSAAPVAGGYERSLRPRLTCFSQPRGHVSLGGDC
jgi:hypothetical protein